MATPLQDASNSNLISVAELESSLSGMEEIAKPFRLEGIVRAMVPQRRILVLQDTSATTLLELPSVNPTVSAGERISIEADHCILARTRFGIRMNAIPVVDNDGIHSRKEMSGRIFLNTGMNPIQLDWFNGPTEFSLNLDYKGPETPRRKVPNSVLWHFSNNKGNDNNMQQGVAYKAYEGNGWNRLPVFSRLKPVTKGVATNFSTAYRTRNEYCGLSFAGFIQIKHPGIYTFYLASDDGSRLYLGESPVSYKVIASSGTSMPAPESFEQALAARSNNHWVQMEGEVTFVSEDRQSLDLDMLVGGNHVPVTIVEGVGLFSTNLLHGWIQVQGVCEFSRDPQDKRLVGVFVPGPEQVKIYDPRGSLRGSSARNLLTTAAQVRRLKPAEADKHIPVEIRGVVIYVSSSAVVLQDSSGGVFISSRAGAWVKQPEIGELWEMEGTTDPGDFSPVVTADKAKFLGYAPLPEPIQPTRDQLMNGNMDAEYGELRGVITSVSSNAITLLTPDGKVSVVGDSYRPLPQLPKPFPGDGSLVGSVVQIRGCFATLVDLQTRQVTPGKVFIYPALVEVEDPAPENPFQLPTRTPSDLMWFDARASALQRTKLAGQIICSLPGEYFVLDNKKGFRVLTKNTSLKVGDLIEAVGFPKLDGPSPILQEAKVRKTGHTTLPRPVLVSSKQLLDRDLDSTLVEVKALLISDTLHQGERVLELQSGPRHFEAQLESDPRTFEPLPTGCRLQLTGVYASAYGDQENVGTNAAPFELLVNNAANIVILQRPSWWTIQHVIMMLVALSATLGVMFIWVALLRRKIEQRTAQLKREIEQRQLIEQHHAIELERTRVARDLHDELGAGLTEVGLLGSLANTPAVSPEAKNRYLNQLTQMARSLVTSLDEIVWAVNPHYDSLASLVSYFSLYAESFLNLANITCRLRVIEDIPQHPLDSKQRHEVFCVFKEALNNIVRHSSATEVQIIFELEDGQLVLSVIDNGCGFEFVPGLPGRDGLAGLRQRMQQLGGKCEITSRPGHGTKVEVHLPLSRI